LDPSSPRDGGLEWPRPSELVRNGRKATASFFARAFLFRLRLAAGRPLNPRKSGAQA